MDAHSLYQQLFKLYGPQGWWPLLNKSTGEIEYGTCSYPLSREQTFEVAVGAILTQNTQFHPNVSRALTGLLRLGEKQITPQLILGLEVDTLQETIRSAGYFRQKSDYLKNVARFFLDLGESSPSREDLLSIKGVGPETADSILLYAFNMPFFVIDTYTKRTLSALALIDPDERYDGIQAWFMEQLPPDPQLFNQYHALLVAHGKQGSSFIN